MGNLCINMDIIKEKEEKKEKIQGEMLRNFSLLHCLFALDLYLIACAKNMKEPPQFLLLDPQELKKNCRIMVKKVSKFFYGLFYIGLN